MFIFELITQINKMKSTLIISVLLIFFWGCQKLGYTTSPQLSFQSVNTNFVAKGQNLIFTLGFSDKEGDISDSMSVLWVQRQILSSCKVDSFSYYYPSAYFLDQRFLTGTIEVRFTYGISGPYTDIFNPTCEGLNDTCIYRFVLRDRAGNTSDTIESPQIVIEKNR